MSLEIQVAFIMFNNRALQGVRYDTLAQLPLWPHICYHDATKAEE